MTDDHVFIDTARRPIHGKEPCLKAWQGFFSSFPDYQNIFDGLLVGEQVVSVIGRLTVS
jgi:hypothetical protein